MGMTPAEFAAKWKANTTKGDRRVEGALHRPGPHARLPDADEADPTGDFSAFEKGLTKSTGGGGFADVWKEGFFAWCRTGWKPPRLSGSESAGEPSRRASSIERSWY